MQTIWGRASQARTSCRCPSCSFQHRSVPRRRTTSSIAQHLCSSTTGFAVSFSTAVAGASYLDARSKNKRRAALDNGIAQARAEVQALREDQEARLRALGIDPAAASKVAIDEKPKPDGQTKPDARVKLDPSAQPQQPLALQKPVPSKPRERTQSLKSEDRSRPRKSDSISMVNSQKEYCSDEEPWNVELLAVHLSESPQNNLDKLEETNLSEENRNVQVRLRELDVIFKQLRESIWHLKWNDEEVDERIHEVRSAMESQKLGRAQYSWDQSLSGQWSSHALQEDELLQLFSKPHSPVELLLELTRFLTRSSAPPGIHTFNIIIIGLCDHGLPCAARLFLECLRRGPLNGNAVTHEAAIRYSLLDREERFFVAYYDDIKCRNPLGWHNGLEGTPGQRTLSFKSAKRLHRGFDPKVHCLHRASMTHSGAEAVIRAFLRSKRIQPALKEYKNFRDAGRKPTMHLLESFLRYSMYTGDLDLGLSTWRQIQLLSDDKPPSSAYYWMLGVLACPPPKGSRPSTSAEDVNRRVQLFETIAAELAQAYGGNDPLQWHGSSFLGVPRKHLFQMARKIEDMSVPQWRPGAARVPLPDLLNTAEYIVQDGSGSQPSSLGGYICSQLALLKEHVPSARFIHRSRKYEDFFGVLSTTAVAADLSYRGSKAAAAAAAAIQIQEAAKPVEVEEASIEPSWNEEWEDIEELSEPRSLMPATPRGLLAPATDMLPWPVAMRSLPMRLPRPYAFPSSRLSGNERLIAA